MKLRPSLLNSLFAVVVFIGIIIAGKVMPHMPNFAPVAAVAMFLAFMLGTRWSLVAILAGLGISDFLFVGAYPWEMMVVVYGSLALPAFFGPWLRDNSGKTFFAKWIRPVLKWAGLTFAGSLAFYLLSNGAEVLFMPYYETSFAGLMESYTYALPFFRNTLMGDFFYSGVFFGVYVLVTQLSMSNPDHKRLIPIRVRSRNSRK